MKQLTVTLATLLSVVAWSTSNAQILPPYSQSFDSAQCTGWNHYAVLGADNWERGVPIGNLLHNVTSSPNVWGTNLAGATASNSIMALETPYFDLSDVSTEYALSFAHQYYCFSYQGGNIEYTLDSGATWQLLNGTAAQKSNWYTVTGIAGLQGQDGWSGSNFGTWKFSTHSLIMLQGQPSVKFRFKYGVTNNPQEGWVIDNFSLYKNVPNLKAMPGITYNAAKNFTTFDVTSSLIYQGLLPPMISNTTNYYFSYDNVLDGSDVLLGTKTQSISSSQPNWSKTLNMVPNLHVGDYYIFYTHDVANTLAEGDETDNTSYCILHIDSTFTVPEHKMDFEDSVDYWKTSGNPLYWVKGTSNVHQTEGTHSGSNGWYIKNPLVQNASTPTQYLESPYLDLTPANNNVICFWYKMKRSYPAVLALRMETSGSQTVPAYTSSVNIPVTRFDSWDCNCQSLASLNGKNNAKVRFKYDGNTTYQYFDQNVNIDDIYIGQPKADLTIETKNTFYTATGDPDDTLHYTLFNGGPVAAGNSVTEFYWSSDSLPDMSDVLLSSVSEPSVNQLTKINRSFHYTKPTQAAGTYYIIYKLDKNSAVDELWEENNTGYLVLHQTSNQTTPYFNDFETQTNGWRHDASIGNDEWQPGMPAGTLLNAPFSGSKAWSTTLHSPLSPMSRMHLYTPVFDLSSLSNPVMEFDMKLHANGGCHCFEGQTNMSYSTDGGNSWQLLDTTSQSYNRWYYPMDYDEWGGIDKVYYIPNHSQLQFAGEERCFAGYLQFNSRDVSRNTRYILDLRQFTGTERIQFRFNTAAGIIDTSIYTTDPMEGLVVDNFRIREKYTDLLVPYKKQLMISSLNQQIKFTIHIKNQGNYISSPAKNRFYLSADTLLDAADYLLGYDSVSGIRPDMSEYCTDIFAAPSTLSAYAYLVYELDINNAVAESDEQNNSGYWPLALDSIHSFPYYMPFTDTVLNGWFTYTTHYGDVLRNQWRFRNIIAPGEPTYQAQLQSFQLYTDRVGAISMSPRWFIESPAFDFSNSDTIHLSFKRGVWSASNTGGNMDYSTDGGNTWNVLTQSLTSLSYNWYFSNNLQGFNEPGWTITGFPLDSVYYNLNFLAGQPHVVFRYKHIGTNAPFGSGFLQGMRIDDFRIDANSHAPAVGIRNDAQEIFLYTYEDRLYIRSNTLQNQNYKLSLLNMLGQEELSELITINSNTAVFDLPKELSKGVYLLQLSDGNRKYVRKIVCGN